MYPTDYIYSKEHEWVAVEDDTCTIGITDFAQEELGEIVFVEMPEVGASFSAGDKSSKPEPFKFEFDPSEFIKKGN